MAGGGVEPGVAFLRGGAAGQSDEVRVADRLVEDPEEGLGVRERRGQRRRELLGADHAVPRDERVDRVLRRAGEVVAAGRLRLVDRVALRAVGGEEPGGPERDGLQVRVAGEAGRRAVRAPPRALPVEAVRRRGLRHRDRGPPLPRLRHRRRGDADAHAVQVLGGLQVFPAPEHRHLVAVPAQCHVGCLSVHPGVRQDRDQVGGHPLRLVDRGGESVVEMREGGGIDRDGLLPTVDEDLEPAVRDLGDRAEPRARKADLRRGPREQDPVPDAEPDRRVLPPDARPAAGGPDASLPRDRDLDRGGVVHDPQGDRLGADGLVEPVDVVVGVRERDPARVLRAVPEGVRDGRHRIVQDLRFQPHRAACQEVVEAGLDAVPSARQRRDGRPVAVVPLPQDLVDHGDVVRGERRRRPAREVADGAQLLGVADAHELAAHRQHPRLDAGPLLDADHAGLVHQEHERALRDLAALPARFPGRERRGRRALDARELLGRLSGGGAGQDLDAARLPGRRHGLERRRLAGACVPLHQRQPVRAEHGLRRLALARVQFGREPGTDRARRVDRGLHFGQARPPERVVEVVLAPRGLRRHRDPEVVPAFQELGHGLPEGAAGGAFRGVAVRGEDDLPALGERRRGEAADTEDGPGLEARRLPGCERGFRPLGNDQRPLRELGVPRREAAGEAADVREVGLSRGGVDRRAVRVDQDPLPALDPAVRVGRPDHERRGLRSGDPDVRMGARDVPDRRQPGQPLRRGRGEAAPDEVERGGRAGDGNGPGRELADERGPACRLPGVLGGARAFPLPAERRDPLRIRRVVRRDPGPAGRLAQDAGEVALR